ncbi:hypothetical protein CXB51_010467 [Gossypium anomalum]|uniref:Integrase catalytic domain-containing protein n=1 Tax=Gossypium anomalum TaxID=47600 RepID=A0A8J5Z6Q0_9ROSI|nr:hypothetical protein CXB51_010467 [Gossypium anomalum]
MATEGVSDNNGENRQSFNTAAPVVGSSPDPGDASLRKIQQFPKHDTVKLGENNFLLWKQQVLLILEGYGLQDFVLGTLNTPSQSVIDKDGNLVPNPAFLFHKQQDKLLASWLLSTICDEILVHFTNAQSSFDVWNTVVRRFASKSTLTVSTLRHSLYSQKKGQLTVKEYLAKIKSLCDTLMAIGSGISEQEQISVILAGLPVEFESIRVVASAMCVPLDLLAEMLIDCETRQQDLVSSVSFQANVAQKLKSSENGNSQFDGGSRSSYRGNGRFSRGHGRGRKFGHSKPQCQLCGRIGHTEPSTLTSDGPKPEQHLLSSLNTNTWYPDSGASHHVTNDLDNLKDTAPYTGNHKLYMGNGLPVPVAHVGSGHFTAASRVFHLKNVLHVPRICKNLLSIAQFAKDNQVYFEFHPVHCFVKDVKTGSILLVGHIHNGLYKFDLSASSRVSTTLTSPVTIHATTLSSSVTSHATNLRAPTPSTADFDLWHRRLGHPCNKIVISVLRKCNMDASNIKLSSICSACQLGKFHKLPFSPSFTVYSAPFELIVAYVWGPASITSEGHSYYISFVDAYSRYTWLYLIKNKSEALAKFLHLYKFIEVQFGCKVKVLQTNWGGEFRSFPQVLSQLGIHHRLSCPHTSEQNGLVERKHRHIVDIDMTLLAQAKVPMHLWVHAFTSPVHLINRLPTSVLDGKCPYELLHKSLPNYMHLRVFGCRCYPYLRPFNNHKLQFRSKPCVFLGYSPVHKGYKCLYDIGRMFMSRHVVFDETCFPFAGSTDSVGNAASPDIRPEFLHRRSQVPMLASSLQQPVFYASRSVSYDSPGLVRRTADGLLSASTTNKSLPSPGDASSQSVPSYGSHSVSHSPPIVEDHSVPNSPQMVEEVSALPVNSHPMQTRSKSGIFKPRVFSTELTVTEPTTIDDGFSSKEWTLAAQEEYEALLRNNTWDLVPLPANRRAVGCKWVFKLKCHSDGTIARYKGRLVVKGYLQEAGIDFHETFSPVVKPTTIRVVLALAQRGGPNLVCRLKKALYGLKQAPRAWFSKLRDFLLASHFMLTKSDGSLFIKNTNGVLLYVLIYVDDIIVTGNHQGSIDAFVTSLDTHQRKYIQDLLKRAHMDQAKGSPTPMTTSTSLSQHVGSAIENESDYRSIVGALQYVVITRPDITFAVNKVCQFMYRPLDQHFKAVKRILRYLQSTMEYGFHFTAAISLDLVGFSDANWGTDVDDRRSTTGFCVFLGGNPVAWGTKKQQVVSRSTTEAEYRSLAHTATEVVWLESILSELDVAPSKKAIIWCDNSGAVAVSANPVLHSKFKHVELDLFFVREKIATGNLDVGHVTTQDQVADIFTKPLSASLFTKFCSNLNVVTRRE